MNKFKLFRNQILFIGHEVKEMMTIESALTRYSIFYKDKLENVKSFEGYDLICAPEEEYLKNDQLLNQLGLSVLLIGQKKVPETIGTIQRPLFIKQCLDLLQSVLPEVKKPELPKIEIGSVVKSKTTPMFGKGIVTSIVSDTDVLVRFPKSQLLSKKNESIRCHISQLQILGNIESYLDKINQ